MNLLTDIIQSLDLNISSVFYFRHGRRMPCILIPILGELVTVTGLMLCTYFENTTVEIVGLTDALFPGLSGNL